MRFMPAIPFNTDGPHARSECVPTRHELTTELMIERGNLPTFSLIQTKILLSTQTDQLMHVSSHLSAYRCSDRSIDLTPYPHEFA